MILDRLETAVHYERIHPGFEAALNVARDPRLSTWAPGKRAIDGDRLFVLIADEQGRGREAARLEAHRRYIDIQLALEGPETIGWRSTASCREIDAAYDPERDIAFFRDKVQTWLQLAPGLFAIFYPGDAHAPLAGAAPVRKAVFKVAVDW